MLHRLTVEIGYTDAVKVGKNLPFSFAVNLKLFSKKLKKKKERKNG